MSVIVNSIDIPCSIERVFAFVTTPSHWALWQPASLVVSPAVDRPLTMGESVRQDVRLTGRRATITWFVRDREPPFAWVIDCATETGLTAEIVYDLTPHDDGTRLRRTMRYRMPSLCWRVLDMVLLRWLLARQSAHALRRLRRLLRVADPRAVAAEHARLAALSHDRLHAPLQEPDRAAAWSEMDDPDAASETLTYDAGRYGFSKIAF